MALLHDVSSWPLLLFVSVTTAVIILYNWARKNKIQSHAKQDGPDLFAVTPLVDFEWRAAKPLQIRPFNPKYHLTMAIEKSSVNEIIHMDQNYLNRIQLRSSILEKHSDSVVFASDKAQHAIDELYEFLFTSYLPVRFPSMFFLCPAGSKPKSQKYGTIANLVTGCELPARPSSGIEALRAIAENLDEDFLVLLEGEGGEYVLEGSASLFPNGFDPGEKFGKTMGQIHVPVPEYQSKLAGSLNRYFARLEVGKVVKRANWNITTSSRLFTPTGNHLYVGETVKKDVTIDISEVNVRVERQVLFRLPKSRALVLAVKTLMYPIQQIKAEGSGTSLCDAIDGLKSGSAPGFWHYKGAPIWGEVVKRYLREE